MRVRKILSYKVKFTLDINDEKIVPHDVLASRLAEMLHIISNRLCTCVEKFMNYRNGEIVRTLSTMDITIRIYSKFYSTYRVEVEYEYDYDFPTRAKMEILRTVNKVINELRKDFHIVDTYVSQTVKIRYM